MLSGATSGAVASALVLLGCRFFGAQHFGSSVSAPLAPELRVDYAELEAEPCVCSDAPEPKCEPCPVQEPCPPLPAPESQGAPPAAVAGAALIAAGATRAVGHLRGSRRRAVEPPTIRDACTQTQPQDLANQLLSPAKRVSIGGSSASSPASKSSSVTTASSRKYGRRA